MERVWFVCIEKVVHGPLDVASLEALVQEEAPQSPVLVWWRGQSDWVSIDQWRNNLPQIVNEMRVPVERRRYHLDLMGERLGPLSVSEIKLRLQSVRDLDSVRVWNGELRRWFSVYEIEPLCEAMGLTRRVHLRVPLSGSCTIQKDQSRLALPVVSVSAGGLGLKVDPTFDMKGLVQIELQSPALFLPIKTRAEIAYKKEDGTLGLKFQTLSSENQAALVEYIKNFELARVA